MTLYIQHNIQWFYDRVKKQIKVKTPDNGEDTLQIVSRDIADFLFERQADNYFYSDKD